MLAHNCGVCVADWQTNPLIIVQVGVMLVQLTQLIKRGGMDFAARLPADQQSSLQRHGWGHPVAVLWFMMTCAFFLSAGCSDELHSAQDASHAAKSAALGQVR